MSDLKTELKPLMRDVDDELDTVTIHIEMDKDAFKRFMSGNLSKIKCGYPDTYRDDPAYLETFIRFYWSGRGSSPDLFFFDRHSKFLIFKNLY